MAEKRPSDRKQFVLQVRLTKAERAVLNKQRQPGESLSDVARRKLFSEGRGRAQPHD